LKFLTDKKQNDDISLGSDRLSLQPWC
jgi:hypothetical protein